MQLTDVVFNEMYSNRVKILMSNAHMEGQSVGIKTILLLMKDFEDRDIEITVAGMIDYLDSVKYKPDGKFK